MLKITFSKYLMKDPGDSTEHKPWKLALEAASLGLVQVSSWRVIENKWRSWQSRCVRPGGSGLSWAAPDGTESKGRCLMAGIALGFQAPWKQEERACRDAESTRQMSWE